MFLLHLLSLLSRKYRQKRPSLRELLYIAYAALIRGAIAFSLVTRLPSDLAGNLINPEFYKTIFMHSTFMLIIITTVSFGMLTPLVHHLLFGS